MPGSTAWVLSGSGSRISWFCSGALTNRRSTPSSAGAPKLAPTGFSRATVQAYRAALEAAGLSASSINIRLSAIRKLAAEAADNGLLAPDAASAVARVRGAKRHGARAGNWLTLEQAERLLELPHRATNKGKRDRALLGVGDQWNGKPG